MLLLNQFNKSSKLLKKAIQDILDQSKSNLTTDQWLVLSAVKEIEEPKQAQLADLLNKETASLSRIIDLLVDKHLLKRKNTVEDRRAFIIEQTVEGSRLYKLINPKIQKFEEELESASLYNELVKLSHILNDISTIDNLIID